MQGSKIRSHRHGLTIIACLFGIAVAQNTLADCTPGYKDNPNFNCNPPASPALHALSSPQAKSNLPPNTNAIQFTCPPGTQRYQGHCVAVPHRQRQSDTRTQHSSSASEHGIIFVGGKSSLNPQPIPPGHAMKRLPRPGSPVEQPFGH